MLIPNPAVMESLCSGKISPNRRGLPWGRGGEFGESVGEVSSSRYVMDFEAWAFVVMVLLGLLIRLAKDCEFVDSWSSGTDFCLCVVREPGIRLESAPSARVVLDLKAEYDVFVVPPAGILD